MYAWIVFRHVAGGLGFMLAPGTSASAAFELRRERNLERLRALLASTYILPAATGGAIQRAASVSVVIGDLCPEHVIAK